MARCRKCGQPAGNNRRTCKLCSLEDRYAGAERRRASLQTHEGRSVGAWIRVDGTWHASVTFDGYVHEFACGHEFDDFPAEKAVLDHHRVDADAICDGCRKGLDPQSIPITSEDDARFVTAAEIRTDGGGVDAHSGDGGSYLCERCQIHFRSIDGLVNHVCIPVGVDTDDGWLVSDTPSFAGGRDIPAPWGDS